MASSCGRRLASGLAVQAVKTSCINTAPMWNHSQVRSTFIMKRVFDVPLAKSGQTVHLKRLQFVYEPRDTLHQRLPDVSVVLTQFVEGVGDVGDVVKVRSYIARNDLLLPGLAVYNTPENVAKYTSLKLDRPRRTPFCLKTIRQIEGATLFIPMNADKECQLNKNHIRIAFRLAGVELSNDCILLPEEPILSTQQEEFTLELLINRLFTARVRARIHSYSLDASGHRVPPPNDHQNR